MTARSRGGVLEEVDHFGRDDLARQHVRTRRIGRQGVRRDHADGFGGRYDT
ncbi:hypothetical protein [Streptomyces sp. NPDC001970]